MLHVDHVWTVQHIVQLVHLPQNVLYVQAHINSMQQKNVLSNVQLVNMSQPLLLITQQQIPPQMQQES